MQADFVLFLQSLLKGDDRGWYPISLIFAEYTRSFELFVRAETDDGFEVLKTLLGIASRDDLMNRYSKAIEKVQGSFSDLFFHSRISFEELMNFEKICPIKSNV